MKLGKIERLVKAHATLAESLQGLGDQRERNRYGFDVKLSDSYRALEALGAAIAKSTEEIDITMTPGSPVSVLAAQEAGAGVPQ